MYPTRTVVNVHESAHGQPSPSMPISEGLASAMSERTEEWFEGAGEAFAKYERTLRIGIGHEVGQHDV
jgi:hypothetical protein